MPNDARLGLVVGVTLVILVAILFARKDTPAPVTVSAQNSNLSKVGLSAPVPGVPSVPPKTIATAPPRVRSHKVEEGETLMSLSKQYYGDTNHVGHLFRANQDRILAPDRVPMGTVLRIPDAPATPPPSLDR